MTLARNASSIVAGDTPTSTLPTIKKRSDFLAAAKGGRKSRRAFVMLALERSDEDASREARVGYTVSKKNGNSVVRSRIKRRLRAAVTAASKHARAKTDYVLIARREALRLDFSELTSDIAHCLATTKGSAQPGDLKRRRISKKR